MADMQDLGSCAAGRVGSSPTFRILLLLKMSFGEKSICMRAFTQKIKNIYFLSFIIPILLLLGIFVARGIFPFGKNSFMYSDMYHQYIPFLTEFRRKLCSGESLAFSWNVGLGSNFLAIYAYYLASPIYWLSILVPEGFLIEFMSYLVVVKIGLCGLTFSYYLSRKFNTKDLRIVWFAVIYAMSGYIAAYNWNHMWLDCLYLAPLIIWGLEELVRNGKCRMYCMTLTACIFTNYYLSILICIFLVLYFVVQLFTNGLTLRKKGRAVVNFGMSSLLAGGMSAVLLVPVAIAMMNSDFHGGSFPKQIEVYFNALEVLARHTVMLPVERGLDHWPNLYCGVLFFVLVPVYLFHKRIPFKEKLGKSLLLMVMVLSFSVNILNFIWHGLNYPNSLPARHSFLYIFVVLTMCFEAVYRDKENGKWNRIAGVIAGALLLVTIGVFVTTDGVTVKVMASTWIFLAGYMVMWLLFAAGAKRKAGITKERLAKCGIWAVLLLIMVEVTLNMEHTSITPVQRTFYMEKKENYQNLMAIADGDSDGFYRMDSMAQMCKNDGTLVGYASVSAFSSGLNGSVEDYYDKLGMGSSKVSYYYQGATPFTAALLGVSYTVSEEESMDTELYDYMGVSGDLYLYRNKYTLPVGFMVTGQQKEILESNIAADISNPLYTQSEIVRELCGAEKLFTELASAELTKETGKITVSVTEDGHIYGLLSKDPEGVISLTRGENVAELKKISKKCIVDLGWFAKGETFSISSDVAEELFLRLFRLDTEPLDTVITLLGKQPFTIQSYTETSLNGTIEADEEGYLVLSIPYESGFTIKVDDEETEAEKFADTMIAIPLTVGSHSVELTYSLPGTGIGLMISLISLLLFCVIYMRKKKENREERETCEEM